MLILPVIGGFCLANWVFFLIEGLIMYVDEKS